MCQCIHVLHFRRVNVILSRMAFSLMLQKGTLSLIEFEKCGGFMGCGCLGHCRIKSYKNGCEYREVCFCMITLRLNEYNTTGCENMSSRYKKIHHIRIYSKYTEHTNLFFR